MGTGLQNSGTSKHPGGRPTKYKSEYCERLIDYIHQEFMREVEISHTNRKGETWTENKLQATPLRFLTAFAREIGVAFSTLREWASCGQYPEFSAAYACAREIQTEHLLTCGLMGLYDATMTKFAAVNLTDLSDKSHIEHAADKTFIDALKELSHAGNGHPNRTDAGC